ncbi:unnamed protein product, partial [Ectocarpus sp. 12 AP-2014]
RSQGARRHRKNLTGSRGRSKKMILSKGRSALGTSTAAALSRSTARGISAKIVPSHCPGHTDEPCCYCSGPAISRASAASPTATNAPAAGSPRQIFHTSRQVEFNLSPEVVSVSGGDAPLLPRVSGSSSGGARFKSTAAATADLDVEISRDVVVDSSGDDGGGDSSSGLTSFRLTDIGEGILEVEVLQWFVAPGDSVSQFDKLCEVQSDKANVEITSRYDGVVRNVHWNVGDMVQQTGAVLVDIEERAAFSTGSSTPRQSYLSSAESTGVPHLSVPSSPHPAVAPPAPAETVTPESTGGTSFGNGGGVRDLEGSGPARRQVLATPAVRRLCREMSIDLAVEPIPGTGPGGRLLKGDVLA